MKRITTAILPMLGALIIQGCVLDDDDDKEMQPEVVAKADVRVIHGGADAPKVNITVNGATFANLEGVDYLQASGFVEVDAATYDIGVDAILPDASTATVLAIDDAALAADTQYTVIAHGYVAEDGDTSNDLDTLVIANARSAVTAGNIRLQVVHAAANAPAVDVYLTTPTGELDTPTTTLAYGDYTAQLEVAAGSYRVRLVLPEGTDGAGTVAFDATLPELSAGSDWIVAALPNTGVTTSPVVLLANNGTDTAVFMDDRTQAWVRVGHAAADVPSVDILADGSKIDELSGATFPSATDYVAVDPGTYQVDTALTSDNSIVGITADLTLDANDKVTVLAVGTLATEDPDIALEYYVLDDSTRRVATEAKLRLTHAHPTVGNVDIYLTADGNIAGVTPAFSDVPYKANTDWVSVAAGDYVVTVTPTGNAAVEAINTGTITLDAGGIYSAVAVDNAPGNLLLMDDFTAM